MGGTRLPSEALWRALRVLSDRELRRLRERTKDTRWAWLIETLLGMDNYSDEALRQSYERTFPQADERLLRVYKRQVWDILEELLASEKTPGIEEEVRLWRKLWLSVVLWRRGETKSAEVLWLQVMDAAIERGQYEMALWGLMLLEMYNRDFHRFAPGARIAQWGQQLLNLIYSRYTAITRKIAAAEEYVASRMEKGWLLPPLPEVDSWAEYMSKYEALLQAAKKSEYKIALSLACDILDILLKTPTILPNYRKFHLIIAWGNMGILLLNLGAWQLYDKWYEAWQAAWRSGHWPLEERFEAFHRVVSALRLGYLIKTQRWREARQVYDLHKKELEKHIFESSENVGFRLSTACGIYLVLLLLPKYEREPIQWRLRVEAWIEQENYRDSEYLWWVFLRWYEAYLSKSRIWIRHWHRRLRQTWQTFFSHDERWAPLLKMLWSLTEGLKRTWRRRAHAFLIELRTNAQVAELWENDSVIFPMRIFVEALWRGLSLLDFPKVVSDSIMLPPSLQERVESLIYYLYPKDV